MYCTLISKLCGCSILVLENGHNLKSLSNHERNCSRAKSVKAGTGPPTDSIDFSAGGGCAEQDEEESCGGFEGQGKESSGDQVRERNRGPQKIAEEVLDKHKSYNVLRCTVSADQSVQQVHEESGQRSVRPAECIIMDYQKEKMKLLTRPRVSEKGYNTEIMLLMNKFGTHMQLSQQDGDLFLACVNNILVVLGHETRIVYKTWKGLKKQCNGDFKDIAPIKEMLIELPKLFPTHEDLTKVKLLNRTRCFHMCILTRIGDVLLRVTNANFHTREIVDIDENGVRHYSSYVTGLMFQKYCQWVRQVFGVDVSPLMVAFYFDETAMSTTRSGCPLFMSIMNATGTCYRPVLLGFCPVKLAYNEKHLRDIIAANGYVASASGLRYAYTLAKRKALDMYLFKVIEPILQYQDCGLTVLVGQGRDQTTQRMVPFLSHFLGDSAALHGIANVSPLVMKSSCRCCTQTNCCDFVVNPSPARDSQKMGEVTTALENLLSPRAVRAVGVVLRHLSEPEKALKALAKSMGVIPGGMMLPSLHRNVPRRLNNYYMSLCIDLLHTLLKGAFEAIIAWILQIILGNSKSQIVPFKEYNDCSRRLDKLLSQFPQKHALYPVRFWHFVKGATCFMKSEALKAGKQGGGTGMFTGGFPAWHFPALALQMLCCFGCCGGDKPLVPDFPCVPTDHGVTYNPNAIIIGTLASALEVYFILKAKVLRQDDLKTLWLLTKNLNVKVVQLFDFKQNFLRMCKVLKTPKNPTKKGLLEYSRNVKQHLLTHLPAQIMAMGADSRSTDTEIGEHLLQDNVKVAFRKSNKDLETTELQMLKHGIEKEFSAELLEHQLPNKYKTSSAIGQPCSTASEGEQEVKMCFNRVINMGASELEPAAHPHGIALKNILHSQSASSFIHPLLEFRELHGKLSDFVRETQHFWEREGGTGDCFMRTWFHSFHNTCFAGRGIESTLLLAGGLRCQGHVDEGIEPFYIRASAACARRREPAFSFLEVRYDGYKETYFVKVLAIVVCTSAHLSDVDGKTVSRSETYLCVARLVKCSLPSKFPFPKYKWEMTKRAGCRLSLDILPLDCIQKPAFMIPGDLTRSGIERPTQTSSNYFGTCSWFCIPFARCIKTVNEPYVDRCEVDSDGKNIFCSSIEMVKVLQHFLVPLNLEDVSLSEEDDFGIGEDSLTGDNENYGEEGEDMDFT